MRMQFYFALHLFLMSVGTHGDSILYAHQQYQPSEVNVRLPIPFLSGTAQLLLKKERNQLTFAGAVQKDDLERATRIIVQELKLYSEPFLAKSKARQIIFCNGLYTGSTFKLKQWGGLADYEHRCILIDATLPTYYLPEAFHHELFHFIDWQMGFAEHDPEWKGLNDPQYPYRGQGLEKKLYSETESIGFISSYAQTSIAEDKAEVFAYLIVQASTVEYYAKRSQVLQRKVDCIKRRLQDFCPEINKDFWANLPARSRQSNVTLRSAKPRSEASRSQVESPPVQFLKPDPPLSNNLKLLIFFGVMLLPWLLVAWGNTVIYHLRKSLFHSFNTKT